MENKITVARGGGKQQAMKEEIRERRKVNFFYHVHGSTERTHAKTWKPWNPRGVVVFLGVGPIAVCPRVKGGLSRTKRTRLQPVDS